MDVQDSYDCTMTCCFWINGYDSESNKEGSEGGESNACDGTDRNCNEKPRLLNEKYLRQVRHISPRFYFSVFVLSVHLAISLVSFYLNQCSQRN